MNETKNFDSSYDSNDVRRRLASAARRLQSVLWKCTLVDVAIIALWLLTGIAPLFGNGVLIRNSAMPASISLLFIICALAPIFTSVARVAMITRVHPKNVRVDMMVNAPTTFRQIAYLTHHPYLGWWQWLGYVAVTAYFISNVLFVIIWLLVFGISILTSLLLIVETLLSAGVTISCTSAMYERGVRSNFAQNVTFALEEENQWARFRSLEERRKWFKAK